MTSSTNTTPARDGSGETTTPPTVRVAVWHTNVVIADVPADLTDQEATEYVLRQVDTGTAAFESVEGGIERGDSIPSWWTAAT